MVSHDVISAELSVSNAECIFSIGHALRAGFTTAEVFDFTKIDRWFLTQIKQSADFEERLAAVRN